MLRLCERKVQKSTGSTIVQFGMKSDEGSLRLSGSVSRKPELQRRSGRSAVALVNRVLSLWWNNHLGLIVERADAVISFTMCSSIPWNMAVPQTTRHTAYNFLRMSTSHIMLLRKEVTWRLETTLPHNGSV